jgi:hypothetical protein
VLAQAREGADIDWLAMSPLVALTGGPASCCWPGWSRAPFVRHAARAGARAVALAAPAGSRSGVGRQRSARRGALAMDDLTRAARSLLAAAGAVLLSWRGSRRARRARRVPLRCC